MESVSRLGRLEVTQEGMSEKREVADGVEDLVADALVLETQLVVEDPRLPDDDGVVETPPRASPPFRSISTSRRNPKVRAGAICSAKDSAVNRKEAD